MAHLPKEIFEVREHFEFLFSEANKLGLINLGNESEWNCYCICRFNRAQYWLDVQARMNKVEWRVWHLELSLSESLWCWKWQIRMCRFVGEEKDLSHVQIQFKVDNWQGVEMLGRREREILKWSKIGGNHLNKLNKYINGLNLQGEGKKNNSNKKIN